MSNTNNPFQKMTQHIVAYEGWVTYDVRSKYEFTFKTMRECGLISEDEEKSLRCQVNQAYTKRSIFD